VIFDTNTQGSSEWLQARKGCITASRFKDARDRKKNGDPSDKMISYAQDVARERCGGAAAATFQSAAMRLGTEEEPKAREAYEDRTGYLVEEVGFAYTEDRKFGVSVDGLVDDDGVFENKTMVSSATLFTALVDGDVSAYADQCNGALWLLGRKWVDLSLWCADLQLLHIIRIQRDEAAIEALEADLLVFDKMVTQYETKLRAKLARQTDAAISNPPWSVEPAQPAPKAAPITTASASLAPAF
jgi:hypothetical protein